MTQQQQQRREPRQRLLRRQLVQQQFQMQDEQAQLVQEVVRRAAAMLLPLTVQQHVAVMAAQSHATDSLPLSKSSASRGAGCYSAAHTAAAAVFGAAAAGCSGSTAACTTASVEHTQILVQLAFAHTQPAEDLEQQQDAHTSAAC